MEKRMINDVYVIEGIDSTSQLVAFYKEVVDKNIEKYVGITTQGIKFKLDPSGEKAVQLKPNEEYALNPMYRKIEVIPIEQVMENIDESTVELESIDEVVQEAQNDDIKESVEVEPVDTTEKDIEIAQLTEKVTILTQEVNLHKERAEQAESREELLKQRNEELVSEISTKDMRIASLDGDVAELKEQLELKNSQETVAELFTLDELLEHLKQLGYEAFIKKI